MGSAENTNTEQQIVAAAKEVFIEKGFAETSMSDIAARAGINRPALHYYFRTKEKMFEAVFADIVLSFIRAIHNIILQDKPVIERVDEMIDIYFDVFRNEPCFPMFMAREVHRDASHLFDTICKLEIGQYASKVKDALQSEMDSGKIKQAPIEFIFYTFYGLVIFPFLSKPITDIVFMNPEEDFKEKLNHWKKYIVRQMEVLLCPEKP